MFTYIQMKSLYVCRGGGLWIVSRKARFYSMNGFGIQVSVCFDEVSASVLLSLAPVLVLLFLLLAWSFLLLFRFCLCCLLLVAVCSCCWLPICFGAFCLLASFCLFC
jgi:hypothetical protein